MLLVGAPFAHANDDVMRNLDVTYDIAEDGTVKVTWEVDWDFGEPGRRGILVKYVQQEPWEDDPKKDARYELSNFDVTSPTGANDSFSTEGVKDGAFQLQQVKIGSADAFLEESRHTYVITYELEGALRTFDDKPEFFWDINSKGDVPIDNATVTVNTPGPVTEANCFAGTNKCDGTITETGAVFKATDIVDDIFSVGAIMEPGSVDNAEPVLVDAGSFDYWGAIKKWLSLPGMVLAGGVMFGLRTLLGWVRRPKDRSSYWADVTPGEIGSNKSIKKGKLSGPFAVRFEPPEGMIAEVGRAYHAGYRPSQLTATLVQMAVEGSLHVQSRPLTIVQGDYGKVRDAAQWELYQVARKPGDLTPMGNSQAYEMTKAMERADPTGDHAVTKLQKVQMSWGSGFSITLLIFAVYAAMLWGQAAIPWLQGIDPDTMNGIALSVIGGMALGWLLGIIPGRRLERAKLGVESLTPRGSALKAQAEGFRQYLATAEAGQLNFEADRDIYRRFLPWAVLFDLTDRWKRIGKELVDMGRMPSESLLFVDGVSSIDELTDTFDDIAARSREGGDQHMAAREAAQRRRESASSGYGSGSGGSSSSDSGSSGGGGGGGSSSSSW